MTKYKILSWAIEVRFTTNEGRIRAFFPNEPDSHEQPISCLSAPMNDSLVSRLTYIITFHENQNEEGKERETSRPKQKFWFPSFILSMNIHKQELNDYAKYLWQILNLHIYISPDFTV